ncbi:TetR-like C-terminal domain-containing protein [Pseudolysinimonas sp.]|uniref:TetR-like C-terminal domain-containing protein n=1 Tax=Pseudolysinimonas sp. TaxID=2680009 RepID=UPI00286CFF25|nr:TetR-like C-terminal domain-containing protein [Pseudolysinimonas sp.]
MTHDDTLVADAGVPDTGDLQADLESWLEDAIARSNSQPTAGLLRGLVAAAAEDSSVAENLFASLSGRAEQALIARVRQAKPVSAETARITVAAITGAIIYALLTNRPLPEGSAAVLAGLIDGGLSRE